VEVRVVASKVESGMDHVQFLIQEEPSVQKMKMSTQSCPTSGLFPFLSEGKYKQEDFTEEIIQTSYDFFSFSQFACVCVCVCAFFDIVYLGKDKLQLNMSCVQLYTLPKHKEKIAWKLNKVM